MLERVLGGGGDIAGMVDGDCGFVSNMVVQASVGGVFCIFSHIFFRFPIFL